MTSKIPAMSPSDTPVEVALDRASDPRRMEANELLDLFDEAIKTVEAGWDKISPKNGRTSLGSMVRDMKSQKDWAVAFDPSHGNVAVPMAEALWVDQESRHGGLLAVPLVAWFSSDALARRR